MDNFQNLENSVDQILQYDDERLRQISGPVKNADFDSEKLNAWVQRLNRSRKVFGGIGIAAPQIGLFTRLVVIDIPAYERVGFGQVEAVPFQALVNPEIVWFDEDKLKAAEGCLSVRGFEGFVVRPKKVGLIAYTPEGKKLEIEAESLYARVLQHEIDHLDGILYPDRVAELRDIRKIAPVSPEDPVLANNRFISRPGMSLVL